MTSPDLPRTLDVAVIGGGQSALAVGYYLKQTPLSFALLDNQMVPGGAWNRAWSSLQLFSTTSWSSLPGMPMPGRGSEYPRRYDVIRYLAEYELLLGIPVVRPAAVEAVRRERDALILETSQGVVRARAVVSATGTWAHPVTPAIEGEEEYHGRLLHSAQYRGPEPFVGARVLVVGGGNSGAQIFAELEPLARATWVTRVPPHFLPDDVDGRVLFEQAHSQYDGLRGTADRAADPFADVVVVPGIRAARKKGVLHAEPMFRRFTAHGVEWDDDRREEVDAVIFATGFLPALNHLGPLSVVEANGQIAVRGTRSIREPRLWLVGYGQWTGFASATLVGVGQSAKATVDELLGALDGPRADYLSS